ncbi:hypothetical protein HNQ54_002624 [Anaerocolumna cellulosilytica]|nr:hypothetical protein [Anaerocolumna cellulosilytica]
MDIHYAYLAMYGGFSSGHRSKDRNKKETKSFQKKAEP